MKIYRSVSEKRTYRTMSDEFVSREFVAGQEIEVPEDLSPQQVLLATTKLLYDLRSQVLTGFVLEQMMTHEEYLKALGPYEGMLQAVMASLTPAAAPAPAPATEGAA